MEKKRKLEETDLKATSESVELTVNPKPAVSGNRGVEDGDKTEDAAKDSLTSEGFAESAQLIVEEMGMKRNNDETLMAEFRKTMEIQTETWCSVFEQTMSNMYGKNNTACQEKLQELYTILARISKLEQEMLAFRQSLKLLYADVETT